MKGITLKMLEKAVERLSIALGEPLAIEKAYGKYSITHRDSRVFGPAGTKSEKYDHAHIAIEAIERGKAGANDYQGNQNRKNP